MGGGGVNFSSDLIARYRQLFAPAASAPVVQAKTAAPAQPVAAPVAVSAVPTAFGFVLPTSLRFDANYAQQIAAQAQTGQESGAELMLRYKQALLKTLDVNPNNNSFVARKAADESEDTGDDTESTDETKTTDTTGTVDDTGSGTTGGTDTVNGNTEGTDTGTDTGTGTTDGGSTTTDGGTTGTDTTGGGTTDGGTTTTDGGMTGGGTTDQTNTDGGTTGTDTTDGTTDTDTTDGTTDTGTIDTGTNGGTTPAQPMSVMAQQALDALTSSIEAEADPAARTKRAAFTQIDADGDGVVSRAQLIAAATSRGAPADSAEALYAELDPTGTGRVTASQFVKNFNLNQINISGMDSITVQPPFLAVNALLQNVSTSMISAPARQSAVAATTPDAFTLADANHDGIATKAELRDMVTSAGGTVASADALYASLNIQGAGGVTKQQFQTSMPMPHLSYFDPDNNVFIDTGPATPAQSAMESIDQAVLAENDPVRQFNRGLFTRLDANGDNTLTKAEVERSVMDAGGTKAAADALYTQLSPNGAGGVSEKQFIASMPQTNLTPQKAASLAATLRANLPAGPQAAAAQTSGGVDTRMLNALLQAQSIVNF